MKMICYSLLTILGLLTESTLKGWVLNSLWGWYIMPISTYIPRISITQFIGIQFILLLFALKAPIGEEEEGEDAEEKEINVIKVLAQFSYFSILCPLLIMFFGWGIHNFCIDG